MLSGEESLNGANEAAIHAQFAREFGVPPAATLTVVGAKTTRGEADLIAARLQARGVRQRPARGCWNGGAHRPLRRRHNALDGEGQPVPFDKEAELFVWALAAQAAKAMAALIRHPWS